MDQRQQHISDFARLMRSKGYTDHFSLRAPDYGIHEMKGDLFSLLRQVVGAPPTTAQPKLAFYLSTDARFSPPHDTIGLTLTMQYDLHKGFDALEQHISHSARHTTREYLRGNQQIIGRQALLARFPKAKRRWDLGGGKRPGYRP